MRFSKLYLLMALATCGHALAADLALTRWAPNLNAEALAFLPNGPERLAASTRDGLLLLDEKGAELARFKGNFSSLDSRAAGAQVLVATLDNQRQQAMLISLDSAGKRWGAPLYLPTRDYPVNGVCLYRDSAANLFVFLVGEEGKGEQWLVGNGPTLLARPQRVRGVPLPPSAQFCQVDDATHQLVVNEENVGWWAYPAHPEAEVKRTPVALFDNPGRAAGAMALVPGGLVALDPKSAQLQLFQQDGERWVAQPSLHLPGVKEAENLAIKGRQLLLRDDDSGNLYQGKHQPLINQELFEKAKAQLKRDQIVRENHEFSFTKLFTCGYCGSGISAEEKWKALKDGTSAHYIYYGCSRAKDRNCKNKYIREEELIEELLKIMDKVNINELGMRQKLEDEIRRFNKLQKIVNGRTGQALVEENDVNIRQYAKYLLKEGSVSDKRELLANLRSRLNYKDKKITLIEEA